MSPKSFKKPTHDFLNDFPPAREAGGKIIDDWASFEKDFGDICHLGSQIPPLRNVTNVTAMLVTLFLWAPPHRQRTLMISLMISRRPGRPAEND